MPNLFKQSSLFFTALLCGCAVASDPVIPVEMSASREQQIAAQKRVQVPEVKRYKRKIAIGRFTNETNYGRSLMSDADFNRFGKQAGDMLASRLIESGNFLVFERPDLDQIKKEQKLTGNANQLIGVDALIVGSVTEFGRSVSGKVGFLSKTKIQKANAKVDVRLVNIRTGHAFFSATGAGESSSETSETAGFGSHASYDASLNDRAIGAAVSDMIDRLISTLNERPWRTDILEVSGNQVFITGGKLQGIQVGDPLRVMQPGKEVVSRQTGFKIALPSTEVATIRITSFFGDNETNEGSIGEISQGTIDLKSLATLYVEEMP